MVNYRVPRFQGLCYKLVTKREIHLIYVNEMELRVSFYKFTVIMNLKEKIELSRSYNELRENN